MKNLTWLNAIEYIEAHDKNYAAQIIATMRQNFAKPYGFSLKGKRATNQDKADWRVWIAHQPLPLKTREAWLEAGRQELVGKEMTETQKRSKLFFLNRFVNNLAEMGYLVVLTPPAPAEETKTPKKQKPRSRRKLDWAGEPMDDSTDKRVSNEEIILKLTPDFYLPYYRKRYPERTDKELLTLIQKQLNRIESSLNDFERYLGIRPKQRQRKETRDINVRKIMMLLGWMFKQTEDLAVVCVTKIVPVVDIRIGLHQFSDGIAYFTAKEKLEAEMESAAESVIEFLLDYFNEYNFNYSSGSKKIYITALINLTKYLYQKINRQTKYPGFEDIEIINSLKRFRSNLPKEPPKAKKIPLTLDTLMAYIEKLKVDLDYPYNESLSNGYLIKTKRKFRSIAHELQRFLMLCLLILVHPLRRRSLAELQWGKTLIKGIKTEEGNFIPQAKMADPSQALYYYDMAPEAYKTGDAYGHYCVALPNHRFQDGTRFYDYLDKYLFEGYRQALLRHGQDHQYLFVRINELKKWNAKAGDHISLKSYSQVICGLTKKITGKTISPKQFRTIYRTYYVNLGAPPNVLNGLAYCMQHSPETAAKDYTWQTVAEKLAPFINFFESHFC